MSKKVLIKVDHEEVAFVQALLDDYLSHELQTLLPKKTIRKLTRLSNTLFEAHGSFHVKN